MNHRDRLEGLLLGCAVGDSVGLPAEGLSKTKIHRRWNGVWEQRLLFGRGMISDDTEHTLIVAECLVRSKGDVELFRQMLAWRLRLWFVALPPGIGLATARACIKLWIGFSPRYSGVRSAGNGPATRSAVIGAFFHDRPDAIESFTRASTEITHSDPRALTGALAIARCAAWVISATGQKRDRLEDLIGPLGDCGADGEWKKIVGILSRAVLENINVAEFANAIGAGRAVSGYVYQTVPVAIYAWIRHSEDFRAGLESVFNRGGDVDTVGAIAGSLLGLECGANGIPNDWCDRMIPWPYSNSIFSLMAERFSSESVDGRPSSGWLKQLGKNLVMLPIVLVHGLLRLVR